MSNRFLLYLLLGVVLPLGAQTNNLTGSPYSLFGLGVSSNSNIGINNALGNGGQAISGNDFINIRNPAAFGSLGEQNVLFDFGFLTELSEVNNGRSQENRIAGNFSNLALAASLGPKSAFGLSISPYSDTGYAVVGIESNIEGSFENFSSNIFGTGALNDLHVSYGQSLTERLRLGSYASYLFGLIEEQEVINVGTGTANGSGLSIEERNYYRGLRLGFGFQYDITSNFTFGSSIDLETSLSARRDRTVQKTLDFIPSVVEDVVDEKITSFRLPTALNAGIAYKPIKPLTITMDYSLRLWDETEQEDNVGAFVNEQDYSFGLQYSGDPNSFRYGKKIKYRAGFNYNTGYLEINQNPVSSYTLTAGIGLPLGLRSRSHLNISYGLLQRGSTTGILIEEYIHTLNINFSLRDIWFVKRKIN
ncbi:MAG: hypothetical protein AAGF77_08625 [Bacteroidota bacterium]